MVHSLQLPFPETRAILSTDFCRQTFHSRSQMVVNACTQHSQLCIGSVLISCFMLHVSCFIFHCSVVSFSCFIVSFSIFQLPCVPVAGSVCTNESHIRQAAMCYDAPFTAAPVYMPQPVHTSSSTSFVRATLSRTLHTAHRLFTYSAHGIHIAATFS